MSTFVRDIYHMESDSAFIDWLAFIYLWLTILHCPAIPYNSLTSHNKPKVKLEKAVS